MRNANEIQGTYFLLIFFVTRFLTTSISPISIYLETAVFNVISIEIIGLTNLPPVLLQYIMS